jgi:D-beta-D-heptose 7-phosphate kinase/D-beta-D-heptose 1-phosphate adenosyltransferase
MVFMSTTPDILWRILTDNIIGVNYQVNLFDSSRVINYIHKLTKNGQGRIQLEHYLNNIILPEYSQQHVVVVGDLMIDRYWYGDVSRISPEAPVPVVKVQDCELRPGGAANVALNIAALGASVELFGFVGCDNEAKQLQELLEGKGVKCQFIAVDGQPTVTKLRLLGRNQQLIRMDFEEGFADADSDSLLKAYEASLQKADCVILSDYAKGTLAHSQDFITMAKKFDKPICIDPKTNDVSQYRHATLLTPNRKEFENMVGVCSSQEEMIERAQDLVLRENLQALLITLGKDGMLLIEKGKDPFLLPTRARKVFDVTGAGDTVIAVFTATYAATQDMQESVFVANSAAGVVVSKLGAETASQAEIRRALKKQNASSLGIVSQHDLLHMVKDAHAEGEKVVMTNGCFDILHSGHIHYLEQAKGLGDRLIVAVNSDESVKILKGDSRPFNPVDERMRILAGLRSVDWVVSFSEETPQQLIGEVLPDVLVKGGDYKVEEIAGHVEVLANGGEVIILDFVEGLSTSSLVQKIRETEVENVS